MENSMNIDDSLMIFKFGEYRWIKSWVDGNLSFSCAGNYINQARCSKNVVQGDEREAVFARLPQDDFRICEFKAKLGHDLEIIPDGDYVLLRRNSAKYKPIFCFYNLKVKDVLALDINESNTITENKHEFDNRVFSGFSESMNCKNVIRDDRQPTFIGLKVYAFMKNVLCYLLNENYAIDCHSINYDHFRNETFIIEPDEHYNELFYKFPSYAYQHEGRIMLKNFEFHYYNERKNILFPRFDSGDYGIAHEPFTFSVVVNRMFKKI